MRRENSLPPPPDPYPIPVVSSAPPPRPNRFQAMQNTGLPTGPRLVSQPALQPQRAAPAAPVADQRQRQMYLAGANSSVTGSAAQLLVPGTNPSMRTLPSGRGPEHIHAALAQAPEGYVDEGSHTSLTDTPYPKAENSQFHSSSSAGHESFSEKYQFASNPFAYGGGYAEPDDDLHTPDPKRDKKADKGGTFFTSRGAVNLGCLLILVLGLMGLLWVHALETLGEANSWHTARHIR